MIPIIKLVFFHVNLIYFSTKFKKTYIYNYVDFNARLSLFKYYAIFENNLITEWMFSSENKLRRSSFNICQFYMPFITFTITCTEIPHIIIYARTPIIWFFTVAMTFIMVSFLLWMKYTFIQSTYLHSYYSCLTKNLISFARDIK